MEKFTKADFRNGFYVKLKNGKWFVAVDDFLIGELDAIKLSEYDDDLQYKDREESFLDVAEVRDCDAVITGVRDAKAIIRNTLLWKSSSSIERDFKKMHRAMWNDIADGKVFSKEEWIELFDANYVTSNCYACEEANKRKLEKNGQFFELCKYCPITPKEHPDCCSGLYDEWKREEDKDKKRELAKKIADLEWKEI